MLDSLNEGLIMIRFVRRRNEYLAYSLPFEVYKITSFGGAMCLEHPGRQSDIPERNMSLAKEMKNQYCSAESGLTKWHPESDGMFLVYC
jgi:hypothetical protein